MPNFRTVFSLLNSRRSSHILSFGANSRMFGAGILSKNKVFLK
ncbi:hypothetical protein LEP1GSC005_3584 [Leptospira santarosai str. ST188]|nr:hypothetical protein LEP1GSC005_3584 [Leptospira santarosai str. ST188]EMO32158.1 hypothetical protein LEP1GSC175_3050 [Leptospira santarosai str. HAI821]